MQNIKKFFVLTGFILLFTGLANAQNPSLLLYYVSGTVGKSGTSKALKKGATLSSNEILYLADKASVLIICSDFTVFKVSGKGRYAVKDLVKKCNKNAESFSSSYFKYVWHEFTQKHGTPDHNPLNYMENIGAVVRGNEIIAQKFIFDTINYYKGTLPLFFDSLPVPVIAGIYTAEYDGGFLSSKLYTQSKINLQDVLAELPAGTYYWQLLDSSKTLTTRKIINILPQAIYQQQVANIIKQAPKTSPAETAFLKAYLLAEKGFLTEAYPYFKQAIKLAPANKDYQKAFNDIFY